MLRGALCFGVIGCLVAPSAPGFLGFAFALAVVALQLAALRRRAQQGPRPADLARRRMGL